MAMKKNTDTKLIVTPLFCGILLLSGIGSLTVVAVTAGNEVADVRTRTWIGPTRVVWSTNVTDAALLLGPRHGQIPEGRFLAGSGCTLERKDGAPSAILLDFGRELHGGIQIGNGLPKGRKRVRIRFGESVGEAMAEQGYKGCQNEHAIRDQELSLPWLGQLEFGNTGFRFVRIDALSEGPISIQFVRAVSLMRPMERVGGFRCSDERVNRVFETAVRTAHLCSQDYLWDGIKRDRLVWQGDMHPEVATLLAVFGGTPVIRQSLDYMIVTTPTDCWMNGKPSYTMWWILCLRDDWMTTGDLGFVRRHADYFRKTVRHLCDSVKDDGDWLFPNSEQGFLDWPTEHNRPAVMAGMRGLYVWSLSAAEELGRALGDGETSAACDAAVTKLQAKRPSPAGAKSAAALLALGGVREPKKMFAETLGKDGMAGVSTFYGYYMLEAMSAADENLRALDTVRDYWGAMLDMGATSFWEDFNVAWTNNATRLDEMPRSDKKDIHGDFGEFCYIGYRHSLCHGWSSGPASWLIRHVLGARILEPGGAVVEVKPFLGDLGWAEGALATAKGPVKVRVDKDSDGKLKVKVDAPKGVRVKVAQQTTR